MADAKTPPTDRALAPVLLEPRTETVVDGSAVQFRWLSIPGISQYRIEVATDTQFQEVVWAEEVGQRLSLMVRDQFPADERTYYWRVLGDDAAGRVHGYDTVESFISGTPEEAAQNLTRPEESYGPYEPLIKGAAVEAAAELTHEEALFRKEAQMGVAHEGIEAGQILGIVLAIIVALVVIVITLFQLTDNVSRQAYAVAADASTYPVLRETQAEAARLTTQYDVVSDQDGRTVYRIPVDRAIDLMVNEAYQQPRTDVSDELVLR